MTKAMIARLGSILFALCVLPQAAGAQVSLGPQISFADEADFGVGATAGFDLGPDLPGLTGAVSFDYFFPGDDGGLNFGFQDYIEIDINYMEFNGNAIYSFPLEDVESIRPYAGGGVNIARIEGTATVTDPFSGAAESASDSDTQIGMNLLGGAEFPDVGDSDVTIFAQIRFELEGGEQTVLTAGAQLF